MSKCIIIGASPDQAPAYLSGLTVHKDDYVICADGGVAHALVAGIKPDLIMGDFDSYQGTLPADIPVVRFQREKDQTDTYLAAEKGLELGYRDFLLTCGMGGRIDHTIANFGVLLYLKKQGAAALLADEHNEVRLLEKESLVIGKKEGYHFSLLPFGRQSNGIYLKGAKYPLADATLYADYPLGISNEFQAEAVRITVGEGPLLLILSRD